MNPFSGFPRLIAFRSRPALGLAFLLAQVCLAPWAAALSVEDCAFRDTYFLPRQLSDFGDKRGYAIALTQVGHEESAKLLEGLVAELPRLDAAGVLPINLNVSGSDTLFEVALDAFRRELPFPSGLDFERCLLDRIGNAPPGRVLLVNASGEVVFLGALSEWGSALETMLSGGDSPPRAPVSQEVSSKVKTNSTESAPTYHGDIEPILRQHCVRCHHADGGAPFALTSYKDAATRSAMLHEVISIGTMPPWYAHGGDVAFTNAPTLGPEERTALRRWHEAGAPEGQAGEESPTTSVEPTPEFQRDLRITSAHAVTVPATGFLDYQVVTLPVLTEGEVWIQGLQVVPSNPRVLHHALVIAITPGMGKGEDATYMMALTAVGTQPARFPDGIAARLPKGSRLALNIHYETTGKEEQDTVSLDLMFPRGPVRKQARFVGMHNEALNIPPHQAWSEQRFEHTVDKSLSLFGIMAHMHLRGRAAEATATFADGRVSKLLSIPAWNFNWQMIYDIRLGDAMLPSGTKIQYRAIYDNSNQNPYNPAPGETVTLGKKTTDEMMDLVLMGVRPFEALDIAPNVEGMKSFIAEAAAPPPKAQK